MSETSTPCLLRIEDFAMAVINKLSVNKVLNKLRSTADEPKSKTTSLEKKLEAVREETERLRAATRRFKRRPPAASSKRD